MNTSKNIVYLYSEVMPYAIAVMRALVKDLGYKVDCICWDQNKRTPYVPVDEEGITYHKRSGFTRETIIRFIEERNPPLMYIVGRMDPLYLETVLHFKHKCRIVTGSDNQWLGTQKQKIATVLSPILYQKYFEYFWVPGPRQYEFARRMGYPTNKIIWNHLTGDSDIFNKAFTDNMPVREKSYPHKMVFAGRFTKVKGLDILMEAFTAAKKETKNDWELLLIGSGEVPVSKESFIVVKDFMSGEAMAKESKDWGVFCLPSTKEPWGVVIHEFTMAGLPIICSDSVGAADTLVINNYNGFVFKTGDVLALKNTILKIMSMSDYELLAMGRSGHDLAQMHNPSIAAHSLVSAIR